MRFLPAPPLQQVEVEAVLADAITRVERQVRRAMPDECDESDTLRERDPALAALLRSAMFGPQATEPDARRPRRVELRKGTGRIKPHGRNCAESSGFSLHANTRVGEWARAALEKLCRYVCRPAVSERRLEATADGNVRITLKNEWAGGVRAVIVSPRDLLLRVLAQVPLPRKPTVHYHGCFAPHAARRPEVVPAGVGAGHASSNGKDRRSNKACGHEDATPRAKSTRLAWAQAFKRAFGADLLQCQCGGRKEVLAAIVDRVQIERILRHVGLWQPAADILSIRGPPEDLWPPEEQPAESWDAPQDDPAMVDWAA